MKMVLGLALSFLTATVALADPIGPRRDNTLYTLNSQLSSSLIREGSVRANVNGYDDENLNFSLHLACDFQIRFVGRLSGEQDLSVPEGLLDGTLLEEIRRVGSYETASYKIRYEGSENIETQNGTLYRNADRIYIYDVDTSSQDPEQATCLKRSLAVAANASTGDIEDLTLRLWAKYEAVPLGGLLRATVNAKVRGTRIQVTMDYTPGIAGAEIFRPY